MTSTSIKVEGISPVKYVRQERRRNTALQPSAYSQDAKTPVLKLNLESKEDSFGELSPCMSPALKVADKLMKKSRTFNKILIARSPKAVKLDEKSEYLSFGKSDYFKSHTSTMNLPLVTQEMLEHNISLENEDDHNLVVKILQKKPQLRIKEEIMFVQTALKSIKFFSQVGTELDSVSYTNLFQNLGLQEFSAGQKVFGYGDIARKFFIILQGSVYILLKNDGIVTDETKNDYIKGPANKDERLQQILNSDISDEQKKKKVEEFYPGFWIVRVTNKGELFGELGLQKSGNRLRSATVICCEDTIVGVWNQEDYGTIFSKIYETKYKEKISFLEKVDAFEHWTTNQISSLAFHVEEIKYLRNKIIFKEGEISNFFYFIKSGEIELRKNINLPEDERSELLQTLEDKEKFNRGQSYRTKKQEAIRVGKIVQGDYFGLPSSLEKQPAEFTATVTSGEVTLITIPIFKLLKFIRDEVTLEKLKEHIICRDSWHEKMIMNFLQVNNYFSSRSNNEQTNQGESSLKKPKTVHIKTKSASEAVPKIIIKSPIEAKDNTSEYSYRSSSKETRARTQSFGGSDIRAAIDSQRFFRNRNQVSKFGMAYEKHQLKLKKFYSDKDTAPDTLENNKEKKLKKSLRLLTCPDSSKDAFCDYGSQNLMNRIESPAYSTASGEGFPLFRCRTEEGLSSAFPSNSSGLKSYGTPLSIKSFKSPQAAHIRTISLPFSPADNSPKTSFFKKNTNLSVVENSNERSKTEESMDNEKPVFASRKTIKRHSSFAITTEIRSPTTPKVLSSFHKKN